MCGECTCGKFQTAAKPEDTKPKHVCDYGTTGVCKICNEHRPAYTTKEVKGK